MCEVSRQWDAILDAWETGRGLGGQTGSHNMPPSPDPVGAREMLTCDDGKKKRQHLDDDLQHAERDGGVLGAAAEA